MVLAVLAMISPAFPSKARDINDLQMIAPKLRLAQSWFVQSPLCCSSKSTKERRSPALARLYLRPHQSSLPSPPNDVGINLMAGPDAAPGAVKPTTGKRKDVRAIVIFTK
jgi:hypothetical protein